MNKFFNGGMFIVTNVVDQTCWEFDIVHDTWNQLKGLSGAPALTPSEIQAPISDHGVILYFKHNNTGGMLLGNPRVSIWQNWRGREKRFHGELYYNPDFKQGEPMRRTTILILGMLIYPISVSAASYYVKPNGNDNLSGLSDSAAWATIDKVNAYGFSAGDDVYFKCGGTWTGAYLRVDWIGTAGNPVVVGAYYGSGAIGVSGSKPVIDGGTHSTSALPEQPSGGTYFGLVHVAYRDFITVRDISIKNSNGCGIYFSYSDYGIAENCDVDWIRASGIIFDHSIGGQAIGCTAHHIGIGHHYFSEPNWGFGLGGVNTSNKTIVKGSIVSESWCEGIGFYKTIDDCIAENNVVYAVQKAGIYIDAGRGCVFRNNMVYGTADTNFYRGAGSVGPGLWISDEGIVPDYSQNNHVYNNLVAYCSSGLRVGCDHKAFENSEVYNNTFVSNGAALYFYGNLFVNSFIRNNIFWQSNGDPMFDQYGSGFSGLTWSNNLWSTNPGGSASGAGDIISIPQLTKITGWRSMRGGDLTGYDFTLQSGSPAINKGADLGSAYDKGLNPASVWPGNVSTLDQDSFGLGWEIGAFIYNNLSASVGKKFNSASGPAEMNVYPNPSYGRFIIRLNGISPSAFTTNKLVIYDVAGNLVEKLKGRSGEFIWINKNVPNGIYLARLEGDQNNFVKKLFLIR